MIISFGSSETEKICNGHRVKKLPRVIQEIGRPKLKMLNNSFGLIDLSVPPSYRLEKLSGVVKGYCSIRINDQWRIIFKRQENNAAEVEILDYH